MNAVLLDKVSKSFGQVHALDNLSVQVPHGSIYSFLGPNGAGKTTTLRMIMNIIPPDSELVPAEQTQELLQIAWRFPDGIGHGFDAFPLQITQLPLDLEVELATAGDTPETIVKLMQKPGQLRFDPQNRVGLHAEYLQIIHLSVGYYWLAA